MASHRDSHIERGAVRVHHRKTLRTVGLKNVSVLPHIGVEDENHTVFLRSIEQRLVHYAGMLDAPASIGPWILRFGVLYSCEYHVDLTVTVGMSGDLPTGIPPLLVVDVELLLRASGRNSE